MHRFGGDEDHGEGGEFIHIISPPRLQLEFCNADTHTHTHIYIYCDIYPHLYLVVAMIIV